MFLFSALISIALYRFCYYCFFLICSSQLSFLKFQIITDSLVGDKHTVRGSQSTTYFSVIPWSVRLSICQSLSQQFMQLINHPIRWSKSQACVVSQSRRQVNKYLNQPYARVLTISRLDIISVEWFLWSSAQSLARFSKFRFRSDC